MELSEYKVLIASKSNMHAERARTLDQIRVDGYQDSSQIDHLSAKRLAAELGA
jgi:hypothetical protein